MPWASLVRTATELAQKRVLVPRWGHGLNVGFGCSVLATRQLQPVQLVIVLLQLAHLFDLVEIHDEARVQIVQVFDALPTEDRWVLAAIEVFDSLVVVLAHVDGAISFVGLFTLVGFWVGLEALFEVDRGEKRVSCDHLVQDVEIERQLVHCVDSFKQLAAHGTPDAAIAEEVIETRRAESVAAADNYPWNAFAHVEIKSTEVADVEAAFLVIASNFVLSDWIMGVAVPFDFFNFPAHNWLWCGLP